MPLRIEFPLCAFVALCMTIGSSLALGGAADERGHAPAAVKSPASPEESLALFELADPDLKVELAAAEPQVLDPVSIAFDERGRMWVVEMGDYPNAPKPGQLPLSRIRLLEDRDGDGRFETAHTFRDHLLFATGIQPWRGGVIVTISGRVVWMKDTDGDGKADAEETWFTGFSEQNPQLRANHPTFAPDNRVYIANGLRGGTVIARNPRWSGTAKPVSISGRDFSFDPLRGTCAAVSGVGQFGTTFDDFGNRFVCSNRNPCQHVVLDEDDIGRTPWAAISAVMHDVSPAGEASHVYPLTRAWTTSTLHAGQFTAACGVAIYRGAALGPAYYGNSFTCEPTGNLVHRDVLEQDGPTFRAKQSGERAEFLASRDEWFRPVNLANGPDGGLYVVDMYRAVIEHPEWVPDELKHRADERWGDDRGRIYRIVPKNFRREPRSQTGHGPMIDARSTSGLVERLKHSHGWHRETAARLLYEKQDKTARRDLEGLVRSAPLASTRALALFVLDGLDELSSDVVRAAIDDRDSHVRSVAVRLSKRWRAADASLRGALLKRATKEDDPRVRFELVLRLDDAAAVPELARLALADCEQEWTRKAVATSLGKNGPAVLAQILRAADSQRPVSEDGEAALFDEVAEVVGAAPDRLSGDAGFRTLELLLDKMPRDGTDRRRAALILAGFNGLVRGVGRRGGSVDPKSLAWRNGSAERLAKLAARIAETDDRPAQRRDAIDVLRILSDRSHSPPVVMKLAKTAEDPSIRLAGLSALRAFSDPTIGPAVLGEFSSQLPPVRRAILDVLLSDPGRTRLLLDKLESRQISVAELDPTRVSQLTHSRDSEIRKRAQALLKSATPADRKTVIADYQKSLGMAADPRRGRDVFSKNCTACHRIGELGVNVAPDIGDSRTMTPAQILLDVLDPNRKVDNNYFSYTAVTKDGKTYTGILATETASSVTLRQQENKTVSLLREQIEELHSNGVSLMPVGLEKNIDSQQMADLIAFIKNWRYLDGSVPLAH